ncbi:MULTISPECIES: hypothetical protein [unclassified Variovorax]|uniref:hypothetical protein n=1 Tax=unclassified Variovorax TaxID=663243 RepID=UPI00076C9691|nr:MULTISPECIES: hypothetical protein [unclassified Variovorax]KWT86100.1 hypothetical protein APY03_3804 [Variovorax sp. WDL1]PNG50089.1 hypothetical protein CHC06_05712 [Variovorax sp. B2]PNG50961.1 hypothetical protein CHC07_05617 [Variovorax sp. B4]VTU41765.1 hypothetical protein SRS16P1_00125 [Variovorax sp. SRS16]VTU41804.1 hypothetical protein E5P1_00125 [Variovorax sp. PBL-E5]
MSTVLFILACGVLCLVVLSKIPGLEHLVKPLIDLVFTGVKVGAASGSYWAIWLTKLLLASHTDLIRHLFLSAEAIDPSMAVRDNEA